ncbi:heme NO-binding domain-containing protein [Winogradskyella sp.]|uniref:heme NO-binding domain-containing protein n=1 Tax=Winogradskyella sp. TaxID=1883156 RepID=UPI003F6BDFEF
MKGMIFTEFLDLVEEKYGLEVVDEIIEKSDLKSNGAYTSVGVYDFTEMLQLLQHLSMHTKLSIDKLLLLYGEHFFSVLLKRYPDFISAYKDPITLLASIENHIHVEVLKLYPDAELPTFNILEQTETSIIMIYKSSRAMHYFGKGIMHKTFEHFGSTASVILETLNENGTEVKFIIQQIT